MWKKLGESVLKYRYPLLGVLFLITAFMGWQATKVKLSYEFSKAIPTDHPKFLAYQQFKDKFGEDGNLLVIGTQTNKLFEEGFFNGYSKLIKDIKAISGVEDIISIPTSVNLLKDEETEKLNPSLIFRDTLLSQSELDSSAAEFLNLPFYQGLLYNENTNAALIGIRINKEIMASPARTKMVSDITNRAEEFGKSQNAQIYLSGLPLIRTVIADRIQKEMRFFLAGSLLLSALILLLFFRSLGTMALSLAVVLIGVIWSLGTLQLFGFRITLLTALIPPLVVVIGIPNCIYFLNKYHTAFRETNNQRTALVQMVEKMGIVTLFCNIAAAIGFAVFALTKSEILKEFGLVAGINIMMLFFISLIVIPGILSLQKPPKEKHLRYLHNPRLQRWLVRLERWSLHHRKQIFIVTFLVVIVSVAGIFRLKSIGYIVDDLPKTDKIYTDLKFFETHFNGVMPLEILVDTKKKYGVSRDLGNLQRIDSLQEFLVSRDYIGKPLSITQALKFARQAFFEGDSGSYAMPSEYDLPALAQYLNMRTDTTSGKNTFGTLVSSFMDSNRQQARISVNMQDVGTERLPFILDTIQKRADELFDTSKYNVQLTGTSVTFVEGSRFIINGLKESIFWAFLLIAACMLYLFKSARILICSLIPNVIPLVITAGVMGWAGVHLKPSTVLIFSVALGIAIDVTIRFLVNYKQNSKHVQSIQANVIQTIHSTGLSIIYTSIVLIAGFVIFCFSSFGGTFALGWLTSLTLVVATVANLVLLPALLISLRKK
jgi:uncharacterized protein